MTLAVTHLTTAVVLLFLGTSIGPAAAQLPEKGPRVGYLSPGSSDEPFRLRRLEAFRQGLRELGYVEGRSIILESRWAEGKYDRYPALLADLIRLKVQIIVAVGGNATQAARQATSTIPIVMSVVIDPLGSGLVSSLARPGGNVTGLSLMAPDLVGKQFDMLRQAVPESSRVAVLWNPGNPGSATQLREAEAAARILGVRLTRVEARRPEEITGAFAAIATARVSALLVLNDATLLNQRKQIAELAAKAHLPSISGMREYTEAGGLIAYGPDFLDLERRAATYVDKILKGAKPGELPVEQPTKFELLINLKTAKALGLTIPHRLLQWADEVIK